MTLDEIATKLAQMSSTVCHSVDTYAVERFKRHCVDENEDGVYTPKIIKYSPVLGHGEHGAETDEDPVVIHIMETALIPQKRLIADKLKIALESDVDLESDASQINMTMTKGLIKSSARITIEAEFVSSDTAESIELIRDHENKHLAHDLKSPRLQPTTMRAKLDPIEEQDG